MYTFVYRTFIKFILFCRGQALFVEVIRKYIVSMPLWAWVVTRDPAQGQHRERVSMPLWAWVVTYQWCYICRIYICFNALMGLSCYFTTVAKVKAYNVSMPLWAWVVTYSTLISSLSVFSFNALMGLSCYKKKGMKTQRTWCFNALMGLSCYTIEHTRTLLYNCFNALMGLSCYGKNVQYFKFFMILFMHTCYL